MDEVGRSILLLVDIDARYILGAVAEFLNDEHQCERPVEGEDV